MYPQLNVDPLLIRVENWNGHDRGINWNNPIILGSRQKKCFFFVRQDQINLKHFAICMRVVLKSRKTLRTFAYFVKIALRHHFNGQFPKQLTVENQGSALHSSKKFYFWLKEDSKVLDDFTWEWWWMLKTF